MKLVTYDVGEFDINKFEPIKNLPYGGTKPWGGLWSSPVDSKFGWKDFDLCLGRDKFIFEYIGNILVINSYEDLCKKMEVRSYMPFSEEDYAKKAESLGFKECYRNIGEPKSPNFELIAKKYDAIHLTKNGVSETHVPMPLHLYNWDCETVLIMNPKPIRLIYSVEISNQ